MKKNEKLFSLLTILLVTSLLSVGFTACGEKELELGDEGPIDIIDDDGIPSGSPGDESMFGYYSTREVWNHNMDFLSKLIEEADADPYSYPWPGEFINMGEVGVQTGFGTGFRIVDGHTIYQVKEGATLNSIEELNRYSIFSVEIDTKTFTFNRPYKSHGYPAGTYTYTYRNFMESEPGTSVGTELWEGRYSVNGTTMTVHTDEVEAVDGRTYKWTYSNGTITVTDNDGQTKTYIKVK